MSRRINRSQYLEDYDDNHYEIVYKRNQKPKYVYASDMSDQYYVINGKYYKKVNSEKPQYSYVDDEEEFPEERIIFKTRRKSPERMYIVDNGEYDYEPDEFEQKYLTPRAYVPLKTKNVQKTRSMEYLPAQDSIFTARAKNSHYSSPLNQRYKKLNHRKEIEEPTVRDKPNFNKPVIFGGAIIHK